MIIQAISTSDFRFKKFIDNFKKEVGPHDHMYDWLDEKKLERIDRVVAIIDDNNIVGISCEKVYETQYLRIGSPNYVLKPFRSVYPNSLFLKNGLFSEHIKRAEKESLEIFFSIHVYNKRMKLHAENFYKRRISSDLKNLDYLDDVSFIGIHNFHYVPQHIFTYNVSDTSNLLKVISRTSSS